MNQKWQTIATYDESVPNFNEDVRLPLEKGLMPDMLSFVDILKGKRILDLGCGRGRDALVFKKLGSDILCGDLSKGMIGICVQRGLASLLLDIENLPFAPNSFDGVWAYASFLHVPKANFQDALRQTRQVLTPEGIFYIGMKEGNFEGMIENARYPGDKRFFSLYQDQELMSLISRHFSIVKTSRIDLPGQGIYLNYLCKKN